MYIYIQGRFSLQNKIVSFTLLDIYKRPFRTFDPHQYNVNFKEVISKLVENRCNIIQTGCWIRQISKQEFGISSTMEKMI